MRLFVADLCEASVLTSRPSIDPGSPHTLIVIDNISKVIASAVVGFSNAHGIMREVDIAVVAYCGARSALEWEYSPRVSWKPTEECAKVSVVVLHVAGREKTYI